MTEGIFRSCVAAGIDLRKKPERMEIWRKRLAKILAAFSLLCFAATLTAFNIALFPWRFIMPGLRVFIMPCREWR
ncbi:hypothetical protein [Rhizobium sp. NFACC06-2]|uniref:hypothetical protein n=1 Tax=Rhizobium sp. NFACC06-2 TaxID=1566264 RepID=UPI00122D03C8|nr:hypothetical protein [Rhizobium sp. NFACC06-2]